MTLIKWAIFILVVAWLVKLGWEKYNPAERLETQALGTWVALQPVSGDGDMTTSNFKAPKGESRIHWEANNPWSRPGVFTTRAKRPDGSQIRMIAGVGVGPEETKNGQCFMREAPEFNLVVNSSISWKITVEVRQ